MVCKYDESRSMFAYQEYRQKVLEMHAVSFCIPVVVTKRSKMHLKDAVYKAL